MSQSSVCPGVPLYRDLLRGDPVPNPQALLGHLAGCPKCQQVARALDDGFSHASPVPDGRRRAREIVDRALGQRAAPVPNPSSIPPLANSLPADPTSGGLGWLGGYRMLRVLGRGGMGIVFEAEDANLRRRVALKVMRPDVAADPQLHARFLREARAMASVMSDHVCPIFQVGEDNGTPFIAMPLLEGEPLDVKLAREKVLSVAEAVRIAREIALGLAAAHEEGLIHRDIKPGNVWLEAVAAGPPRCRLLDFGLVRGGRGDGLLTVVGAMMGTPAYLSLEQALGKTVDARTDLFSLGVILYEMTTGKRPFTGSDPASVLSSLATDTPVPPAALRREVPAALNDLILSLLARTPEGRPDRAEEVAARLAKLQAQGSGRSRWRRIVWAASVLVFVLGGVDLAYHYFFPHPHGGQSEESGPDALAALNAAPSQPSPPTREQEEAKQKLEAAYQEAMKKAEGAKEAQKYAEACEAYAEALRLKPNDPAATRGHEEAGWLLAEQERQAREREKLFREGLDAWLGLTGKLDEKRAMGRFDQAAASGHPVARGWIGRLTWLGRGVKQNKAAGAKLVEAALPEIRQKANDGDPDAQTLLGVLYAEGLGIAKDEKEAIEWYRKAAEQGDPVASTNLGVMYAQGRGVEKDEKEAVGWYKKAARKGVALATYNLGVMYEYGRGGLVKDEETAVTLYQQAADKGYPPAMNSLGEMLANGRGGLAKDEGKAVALYQEAAGKGNPFAMINLGRAHADGLGGLRKDRQVAARWFEKADDAGNSEATCLVGELYYNSRWVDRDWQKAARLYEKAAKQGHAAAMTNLGVLYENGEGVKQDKRKATDWYRMAADKGYARAMVYLGGAYVDGTGVPEDRDEAFRWFEKAAGTGEPIGLFSLGLAYEQGIGVEKNVKVALKWYKEAAKKGHEEAKQKVKQLESGKK